LTAASASIAPVVVSEFTSWLNFRLSFKVFVVVSSILSTVVSVVVSPVIEAFQYVVSSNGVSGV
jgi:hypothetical protein